MFYGAVSDFFAQAVISYFLGHRNLGVFSEFLESLENSEAARTNQMARLRVAAIETSTARVISEDERRLAGWVLLSPEERNVILTPKLSERILLLVSSVHLQRKECTLIPDQCRYICCHVQLRLGQSIWLHADPARFHHRD